MGILLERTNDALNVNPPAGDQYLTENASNWLFAATALFLISFLAVVALTFLARAGEKIFHYILAIALFVAAISYFSYASDLGWDVIQQVHEQDNNGNTRQIFWVKYINWVVEFPAIILILGLLSGIPWATIIYQIFLGWIWVINYLVAAYVATKYKWGFFAFGTTSMILLIVSIFGNTSHASRVGTKSHHTILAAYTVFFWILYPIAWGLSDGGNRIGGAGSAVFYGVLDVVLLIGVTVVTLVLMPKWDYNRMDLSFTQHGRGLFGSSHVDKDGAVGGHHDDGVLGGHRNGNHTAAPGVATGGNAGHAV